jgi:hypothetical protein
VTTRTRLALLAGLALAGPASCLAECQLVNFAQLPVTLSGQRPLVHARINGVDALFVADSGALNSLITPAAAKQFHLPLESDAAGTVVRIGDAPTWGVKVKEFTLLNVTDHNLRFLVADVEFGSDAAGLLGQNVFTIGDVEYDLSHGAIRLFNSGGCSQSLLAYWVRPGESYSVMDLDWATPRQPNTQGRARLNGQEIRVIFATGSPRSLLSTRAAARAGVVPGGAGVVAAGYRAGLGPKEFPVSIGRFDSFKIGDEEIRNARLSFGDIGVEGADMLLGADFFLSHRIFVARSQNKLYFTYNGGPVFNLEQTPSETSSPPPAGAPAQSGGGAVR